MSAVIDDRITGQTSRGGTNMVAAAAIAGVDEPISGAGTPVIRRIPLRLLNVSLAEPGPGYQRTPNMSRVKKIARNWDWGMYEPLVVSERKDGPRAGELFIVDGQHRYLAALEIFPEWQELPALVRPMTFEEEALRFARQGENRGGVNSRDLFRAKVEARDPDALDILAIIEEHGFRISYLGGGNESGGSVITAISTLVSIYNGMGRDILRLALHVSSSAFPPSVQGRTDGRIIGGIAHFLYYFPVIKIPTLIEKLGRPEAHPRRLLQNSAVYSMGGNKAGGNVAVSHAILDQYNRGTSASRLDWDLKKYRGLPAKKKERVLS